MMTPFRRPGGGSEGYLSRISTPRLCVTGAGCADTGSICNDVPVIGGIIWSVRGEEGPERAAGKGRSTGGLR